MAETTIKRAAFAGSWYPGTSGACQSAIRDFLSKANAGHKDAVQEAGAAGTLFGGIVPHAGWVYSGGIACRVISSLVPDTPINTILLFGAHMHPTSRAFVLAHGEVETPLGNIPVDIDLTVQLVLRLSEAGHRIQSLSPDSFPNENTLELQFPFIRHFFPDSHIVICGVPPTAMAEQIGHAAVDVARDLGRTFRVIGSTDMTHYGPNFGFEPAGSVPSAVGWVTDDNDAGAIRAMEAMDVGGILNQGLSRKNMCCSGAAAGATAACQRAGARKGICVAYATSFEKSQSDSFVGYSGVVFVD
ncbi:MAG TPA: AmmeMemoRadiSam system protein B [Desulfobacteraceae bacterium]|nr:AmmeMemoRadiSam system protein B [Desulfobacteraceae bacterium]